MLAWVRVTWVELVAGRATGATAYTGVVVAPVDAGGWSRARIRLAKIHLPNVHRERNSN